MAAPSRSRRVWSSSSARRACATRRFQRKLYRRRRRRRRHHRFAAHRRYYVPGFHHARDGSVGQSRRQVSLYVWQPMHRAPRGAHACGRRAQLWADALAEFGSVVYARARPQSRGALQCARCQRLVNQRRFAIRIRWFSSNRNCFMACAARCPKSIYTVPLGEAKVAREGEHLSAHRLFAHDRRVSLKAAEILSRRAASSCEVVRPAHPRAIGY